MKIFISYAKEDLEIAEKIYRDLRKYDTMTWLDNKNLTPGQNWKSEIKAAINESDFFLALLSNNSVSKRGYVQKELKIALSVCDEFPSSKIFIIPVLVNDCKPVEKMIQDLHWAKLFPSYEEGFKQILKVLNIEYQIKKIANKNDEYSNIIRRIYNIQIKEIAASLNSVNSVIVLCDRIIVNSLQNEITQILGLNTNTINISNLVLKTDCVNVILDINSIINDNQLNIDDFLYNYSYTVLTFSSKNIDLPESIILWIDLKLNMKYQGFQNLLRILNQTKFQLSMCF